MQTPLISPIGYNLHRQVTLVKLNLRAGFGTLRRSLAPPDKVKSETLPSLIPSESYMWASEPGGC